MTRPTKLPDEQRLYTRLLRYAQDTEIGFCLVIVSVWDLEIQRRWRSRLQKDLSPRGIGWLEIDGHELLTSIQTQELSTTISLRVPSGAWVLSLAELENGYGDHARIPTDLSTTHARTNCPSPLIAQLNAERDQLIACCPVPMIMWVTPAMLGQLSEWAPDFYDIRRTVLELSLPNLPVREQLPDLPPLTLITDFGKIPTRTSLAQIRKEAEQLRFLGAERSRSQGCRLIHLLMELAKSHGHSAVASQGINELLEAQAEARRLGMKGERAEIYFTLGGRYSSLGRLSAAKGSYSRSLALYCRTHPNSMPAIIRTLNRLANTSWRLGNTSTAVVVFRKALTLAHKLADEKPEQGDPALAQTLNNQGLLLAQLGRRHEAEADYRQALSLYSDLAQRYPRDYRSPLAQVLDNLANVRADLKDYTEAMELNREALVLSRALDTDDQDKPSADYSSGLYNRAVILQEQGRLNEAERLYRESLEIYRGLAVQHPMAFQPHLILILHQLVLKCLKDRRAEAELLWREAWDHLITLRHRFATPSLASLEMLLRNSRPTTSQTDNKLEPTESSVTQDFPDALSTNRRA